MQGTTILSISSGLKGKAYMGRVQKTPLEAIEELNKIAPYTLPKLQQELTLRLQTLINLNQNKKQN